MLKRLTAMKNLSGQGVFPALTNKLVVEVTAAHASTSASTSTVFRLRLVNDNALGGQDHTCDRCGRFGARNELP